MVGPDDGVSRFLGLIVKIVACQGNRFSGPLTILIPSVLLLPSSFIVPFDHPLPTHTGPSPAPAHNYPPVLSPAGTDIYRSFTPSATRLDQSWAYQFISPSANHSPIHSHALSPTYLILTPSVHPCASPTWLLPSIYWNHPSIPHLSVHLPIILHLAFGRHAYLPRHFKVMTIFLSSFLSAREASSSYS